MLVGFEITKVTIKGFKVVLTGTSPAYGIEKKKIMVKATNSSLERRLVEQPVSFFFLGDLLSGVIKKAQITRSGTQNNPATCLSLETEHGCSHISFKGELLNIHISIS